MGRIVLACPPVTWTQVSVCVHVRGVEGSVSPVALTDDGSVSPVALTDDGDVSCYGGVTDVLLA